MGVIDCEGYLLLTMKPKIQLQLIPRQRMNLNICTQEEFLRNFSFRKEDLPRLAASLKFPLTFAWMVDVGLEVSALFCAA